MKIIPLLPFFDLYAATYNQQELYKAICEVRNERNAIDILNRMAPHLLRVTTPAGSVVSDDTVLTRLRSNKVDVDLILDSTGIGDLGYSSCWSGEGYAIAFKRREDGAEKYYDPEPATGNDIVLKINLNDVFDHEAEGHGAGARATLCAIVQHARESQEWPVTEASMVNTLANISDRFETLRRQHSGHHATLVIEMPAVEDGIAKWSVTLGDPKPDYTFNPESYYSRSREQCDPWGHVTNDMLVHLLGHFSLTQILPLQQFGNRVQVPAGLELIQLIQSRLCPPDYRGGQPVFTNQFGPRFGGQFNQMPPIWGDGNAFSGHGMIPVPCLQLHFLLSDFNSLQDFAEGVRKSVTKQIGVSMHPDNREAFINALLGQMTNVLTTNPFPGRLSVEQVTLETGRPDNLSKGLVVDQTYTNWILYPRTDVVDGQFVAPIAWTRFGGSSMMGYPRSMY